jgi:GDP-L-fucose synthase
LLLNYSAEGHVNVGSGIDLSIADLAHTIKDVVGFQGALRFNPAMPDGTPRKIMDVSHINGMGWKAKTELKEGLTRAYQWVIDNKVL